MSARILVVEDDALEARRLVSTLSHLGHDCEIAEDGDAALRRIETEAFDCVLLDLVLPGLDGMGLLRILRARGVRVPVVAAVTPAGIDAVESALRAGARDFVVKPAGALRLKVSITNALDHAATARRKNEGDVAAGPFELPANVVRFPGTAPAVREQVDTVPLIDAAGHARPMAHLERDIISAAMRLYGGRITEVARRLGIGRSTLYRRITDLGLPVSETPAPLPVAAE